MRERLIPRLASRSTYVSKKVGEYPAIKDFVRLQHRSVEGLLPSWLCVFVPGARNLCKCDECAHRDVCPPCVRACLCAGGRAAQEEMNAFLLRTVRRMVCSPVAPPAPDRVVS